MKKTVRKPIQERSILKKEAITAAAMRLFSSDGYYAINSKDIAKEAGVSTGTFYAYFPDKKAVFLELLNHYKTAISRNILANLKGLKKDSDMAHLLKELIVGIIAIIESYPSGFFDQIVVLTVNEPDVKIRYDQHIKDITDQIALIINTLPLKRLEEKHKNHLPHFIVQMNEALIMMTLRETDPQKKEAFIHYYVKMVASLLS